jgi:hypothetical protein
MNTHFQARWISKRLTEHVRKAGRLGESVILNSCKGFIVVEPKGEALGDGKVLTRATARFELDPAWCMDSPVKLRKARQLLGLDQTVEFQGA